MKQPSWSWGLALAALGIAGVFWHIWIVAAPLLGIAAGR